MKLCVIIPVYNHEHAVSLVLAKLSKYKLPVLLVDDGSNAECAKVLDNLAAQKGITLIRLASNQGKGGAVIAGFRAAKKLGFSHALQIDADGQHDVDELPRFITASNANPLALIAGYPIYDKSVPNARHYGRYVTHIWVWINTMSLRIKDSMCGFRLYPLASTLALLDTSKIGLRMDFDVEIIVKLDWRAVPIINLPIHVSYPLDGISHFQVWRDNLQISLMHARLFFCMLPRFPKLVCRLLIGQGGIKK